MNFESVHEMLRYIKHSGVSGGRKQLSYMQIKNLISIYPLDYLEFEVMFIKVRKRRNCKKLERYSPIFILLALFHYP